MQGINLPISPQGSHVSFSNIEEKHQFQAEKIESSKITHQLKRELKLWNNLFIDLIEILTKVTPYPPIYIQTDEDKRMILRQLCEDVVNKAANPTESIEYQTLEQNLIDCQNKVEELKERCEQISGQLASAPQEAPVLKEKVSLEHKLANLENILKRQVKNRKSELMKEKNKTHFKRKRSDQISESSSVTKNIKPKIPTGNEQISAKTSSASFSFEQIPLSNQSCSNKYSSQSRLITLTDDENDFSNDSLFV